MPINTGPQNARRNINNVEGDMICIENYLTLWPNSPASDVQKVIETMKHKIDESDIDVKNKRNISTHLDSAIEKLKDENIDKKSIAESMKKTNDILKEAKTTGETLKDISVLIGKVATWLGSYARIVGLI